jgi:LuxR family transcriptional regulator, activator of tox operons
MQSYSLGQEGPEKASFQREIASLVEDVGRPAFSTTMFKFSHRWVRADHVTAFAYDTGRKARMVFAENAGNVPVARSLAGQYVNNYWHFDPAELVGKPNDKNREDGRCWAVRTSAAEISHSSYRHNCYTSVDLDNRFSISTTRGDRTIRLSFYRSAGDDFSDTDAINILDSSSLLIALVWRHCGAACHSELRETETDFHARLLTVAPELSGREREVCALIAEGVSSEGIGLRLNVGLNTVHTYRKRAYARLNISSQNELMRLIMR